MPKEYNKAENFNKQASYEVLSKLTANAPKPAREFCKNNATSLMGHFEKADRKGLSQFLQTTDTGTRQVVLNLYDRNRQGTVQARNMHLEDLLAGETAQMLAKGNLEGAAEIDEIRKRNKELGRTYYSDAVFNSLVQKKVKELSINEFITRQSTAIDPVAKQAAILAQLDRLRETVNRAIDSIRDGLSERENEEYARKEAGEEEKSEKKRKAA